MSKECDSQRPSEQSRVTKDFVARPNVSSNLYKMRIRELFHKLKVSADLQMGLILKYAEVTEASEASVSTMAYHIVHKQYDQDTDLSIDL